MLHPLTRAFLQGLRPWLFLLLTLRLAIWTDPNPVLWSLHQLTLALGLSAGVWSLQRALVPSVGA